MESQSGGCGTWQSMHLSPKSPLPHPAWEYSIKWQIKNHKNRLRERLQEKRLYTVASLTFPSVFNQGPHVPFHTGPCKRCSWSCLLGVCMMRKSAGKHPDSSGLSIGAQSVACLDDSTSVSRGLGWEFCGLRH